jgi:hypothetical protein
MKATFWRWKGSWVLSLEVERPNSWVQGIIREPEWVGLSEWETLGGNITGTQVRRQFLSRNNTELLMNRHPWDLEGCLAYCTY